jgi:hypothetical protein
LENNATALKEVKALLKKELAERAGSGKSEGHLAAISRLLLITIAGIMGTK